MADAVISSVISTTVGPIKRRFSYLCCVDRNTEKLRGEATKLEGARARIIEVQRNAETNIPEFGTWLKKADTVIPVDLSKFKGDIINVRCGCLNVKSRYLLSREAGITAEVMEDLRASAEEILRQEASIGIQSRKETEEEIMEDLRSGEFMIMGIVGISGLGKTTMAKNIMSRAREEKLFDEVVMVQQVDILRIQSEIAEVLGLRLKEESLSARADKLHAQLTMWPMRILLILDDIWEDLKFEDILGVPCSMFFTIFFTSRDKYVHRIEMKSAEYYIYSLSEDEAWFLFKKKVGTWIDDSDLLTSARELVKECGGLPLGLTILGETLKNERRERIWKDALLQFRKYDQPHVHRELYNPIRLSYEFLDEDTKSLFLLCCLFPEGHDIHVEYFTMCGRGLHIFAGAKSVEEARNIVRKAFKMLKAHTLLLDGRDENHVRMHDAVRDAAMFLADTEGRVVYNFSSGREPVNYKWISVHGDEINKLPIQSSFPHLRLLKIDNYSKETEISTVDPGFFQGMIALNVLSFRSISFSTLPETTKLLKNLRKLYLQQCDSLETISIVGELLSLEILICHSCDMISELPVEIGRLENLRMLEVYKCPKLERNAEGVISKLVRLEELAIVKSFNTWETNAICEIEHLENLTRLQIEIENSTVAAEMFHDGENVKY